MARSRPAGDRREHSGRSRLRRRARPRARRGSGTPTWRAGRPRSARTRRGLVEAFMLHFAEYYDRDAAAPTHSRRPAEASQLHGTQHGKRRCRGTVRSSGPKACFCGRTICSRAIAIIEHLLESRVAARHALSVGLFHARDRPRPRPAEQVRAAPRRRHHAGRHAVRHSRRQPDPRRRSTCRIPPPGRSSG